jgi:hypothetical protein
MNILHLVSVENFPSLVELHLSQNTELWRVCNNSSLQKIEIMNCPAIEVLKDLLVLRSISWDDLDAETLPEYLWGVEINKLDIKCSLRLLQMIYSRDATSEWGKIQHVQRLNARGGRQPDGTYKHYVLYTKATSCFDTNIAKACRFQVHHRCTQQICIHSCLDFMLDTYRYKIHGTSLFRILKSGRVMMMVRLSPLILLACPHGTYDM